MCTEKLCGEGIKLMQNIISVAHLLTELKTVFLPTFYPHPGLVLKHFWGHISLCLCDEKTMNSFSRKCMLCVDTQKLENDFKR